MKETIESLRKKINYVEANLNEIKLLLKNLEEECEAVDTARVGTKQLLSKVVSKGDEVRLYGKLWDVMEIIDGSVGLISKESDLQLKKSYDESAEDFCLRLDEFSEEYVKKISQNRGVLHAKVRSCKKEDADRYLNQKVEWGDNIIDIIWQVGYLYWLASPHLFYNNDSLWFVSEKGYVYSADSYMCNVRPVVYLKNDIHVIGRDECGVWILEK